ARRPHFAVALDAGRRGLPTAEKALAALVTDQSQPGIARATAFALLADYVSPASLPAVESGFTDGNALVRTAAVGMLEALPPAPPPPRPCPSPAPGPILPASPPPPSMIPCGRCGSPPLASSPTCPGRPCPPSSRPPSTALSPSSSAPSVWTWTGRRRW